MSENKLAAALYDVFQMAITAGNADDCDRAWANICAIHGIQLLLDALDSDVLAALAEEGSRRAAEKCEKCGIFIHLMPAGMSCSHEGGGCPTDFTKHASGVWAQAVMMEGEK